MTPHQRTALRFAAAAALAALSALLLARAWTDAERVGDEEDYRRAACHLVEDGTLSLDPLDAFRPRPSAYREPLYPLWLAALAAPRPAPLCAAPAQPGEPLPARVVWAQWALLAAAAAATGRAAARRAPEPVAWLAAAAVALSPALAGATATYAVEALAAPLALAATLALGAALERPGAGRAALAGAAAGLLALTRVDWLLVAALGALLLALAARAPRRGPALLALALFAAAALAPLALWRLRNLGLPGAPVLLEARPGAVLLVRAELDRALAGRRLAAARAWTPVPAFAEPAAARAELDDLLRPVWSEDRHYFVRARRRWAELLATSADPTAAGRRAAAESRARFLEAPLGHLASSATLFWRGLFVEREPERLRGYGFAAFYALALWAAAAVGAGRALAGRDRAAALPALVVFAAAAGHALLTENLPRFGLPALPALVLAAALALARAPERPAPGLEAAPESGTMAR